MWLQHALEVCADYTKSVYIMEGCTTDGCTQKTNAWNGPPKGRGNHPETLAFKCVDIVGGPDPP